ncbi:MAG TPA: hypothetical protein PLA50_07385, partial [Bacteroidia bacterium]|nr:hypothetical protein [Bacteroidia bacterium]
SFESVEMERLRVSQESANLAREEAAYREQVLLLQQKLARASASVLPADQIPVGFLNDFRSFLSANAGDVGRSKEYYDLLAATLTDLIPQNPYAAKVGAGEPSVARAEEKLQRLFSFPEDEGISRNIMAQIAAVRGGVHETDRQRNDVFSELNALKKRERDLGRNIAVASQPSGLGPNSGLGNDSVPMYVAELRQVQERIAELKQEQPGLAPTLQKATRELQFQQFMIELAFQQRYVHSLIACGFYRLYSRNMAVSPEAYPQQGGSNGQGGGSPSNAGAGQLVPFFANVPALETFLMNRIRDTSKDREAIDNMLRSNQLAASENLIRDMVMTAKYQPELHTIPYEERQRILGFSESVRKLSDALNTQDFAEIGRLAKEIDGMSSDPGMADVKAFAEEHPKKALRWVRQAEVAFKVDDLRSMRSLMDAAHSRAPLDPAVEKAISDLETDILEGGEKKRELERLVSAGDYREAYRRREDFAAFAASNSNPDLKKGFDDLMEKERKIQETLKKCDEFESRSSYPDVWVALSEAGPDLKGDERLRERREQAGRRCQAFSAAYESAQEQERAGKPALALAWYLSALSEAPATTAKLKPVIEELGRRLLNE